MAAMKEKFHLVLICFTLFLSLDFPSVVFSQSIVRFLPGFSGPLPFELETGYVGVDESGDVQLFYYFIKSDKNPREDPLMLWLTGGPGCSSFSGLVYEIGPLSFKIVRYEGSLPTLVLNPNSWTKVSNIIFLDSPVHAGFSYSRTVEGSNTGDILSSKQVYTFLREWFLNHPEFLSNSFYLGGDSYSGKTIPIIAKNIEEGTEFELEPHINFKGYLIGNPITDVHSDANYRIPFVHGMGIISDELYAAVKESCQEEYVNVDPRNERCSKDLDAVSECTSKLNEAHILEPKCPKTAPKPKEMNRRGLHENSSKILLSPPPFPALACRNYGQILSYYWANDDRVQRALNIRKGTIKEWIRCNYDGVHYTFDVKSSVPYHRILSRKNYRSLIYSGDHDLTAPFLGTQAWIRSLNYSIVNEWRPWFVDNQVAGYTRTYANNMTFATVKGGGHTAAQYCPKECLAMFTRWISYDPL